MKINIPAIKDITFYDRDKKTYSINELSTEDPKVKVRNIHYYVNKGLVPRPSTSGRNASYSEEHRIKLLVIKKLRWGKAGMSLEQIEKILKSIKIVDRPSPDAEPIGSNKEIIERILNNYNSSRAFDNEESGPLPIWLMTSGEQMAVDENNVWKKLVISDGVELFIRSDVEKRNREILDNCLKELENLIRSNRKDQG